MIITVQCKYCGWEGGEKELKKVNEAEHCPSCNQTDGLLDNELSEIHHAIMSDLFGFD